MVPRKCLLRRTTRVICRQRLDRGPAIPTGRFGGTDELTLNHGVGRIAGTAHPRDSGNIGIAGHRDGFFRGLKDVAVGDIIDLKTLTGTNTYAVDRIQIVSPRQVEVLGPTSVPSITLVTCYPFYFIGSAPQRYIVTASLSSEKDAPEKIGGLRPQDSASRQLQVIQQGENV